ncbi:MAG: hypothetical protein LBL40_01835 [Coxiellaceae bacterium]|jgi:uncharacterized BrkB/YihY/UPF0761 family membrane protein|nr:hypothetical protein [Coxiellaceae bacterium]
MFLKLLCILLTIYVTGQLFIYLRRHPGAFSKKSLSSSLFVLGILALLLIGLVSGLVFWLNIKKNVNP